MPTTDKAVHSKGGLPSVHKKPVGIPTYAGVADKTGNPKPIIKKGTTNSATIRLAVMNHMRNNFNYFSCC